MTIYMKFNITKRLFMVELMDEEILAENLCKEIVILIDIRSDGYGWLWLLRI